MKATPLLQLIIITAMLSSCVSTKKYNELEAKYQKSNIESQGAENRIESLKYANENLERQLKVAEQENKDLKQEIYEREDLKYQELNTLQKKYNDLYSAYDQLLKNSSQEANANRQYIEQQNAQLSQLNNNNQTPFNGGNQNQTPFNGGNQNQTPFNGGNQNQVYTQQNNSNSPVNKEFSNVYQQSSNLDNKDYGGSTNQGALLNLQNQLARVLQEFRKDEAHMEIKNGNLYLNFSDPALFLNAKYDLSSRAQQALKNVSNILKNTPNVSISLVSEDSRADDNPDGLKKVESLGAFLQTEGLNYYLHKKNFAPLAFNTTGTQAKVPQTFLIIQAR